MIELSDIIKKDKIIKVDPEETLSLALSRLATSHDAAFVFDKKNKFLGIINPYYSLIRSSHPFNAKVMHCLHHPPKIYIDYSLAKIAGLFIESKVHYLPVFDRKDYFLGIISARRILSYLGKMDIFKKKIETILGFRKKPLTVLYEDESISQAINLFRKTRYSKLVVINRDMKIRGILSYYDLISFMMTPRNNEGRKEIKGNKSHFGSQPVRNFIKTYVLTLKKEDLLRDVFRLIIDKKIGSVVIVNDEKIPQAIITTRDILRIYIESERFRTIREFPSKIGRLLSRKKT